MSEILARVQALVARHEVRISDHGYDELAEDGILAADVLAGVLAAIVVEDYPDDLRGPSFLALQRDVEGKPIHVVWGIPKGSSGAGCIGYGLSSRPFALVERLPEANWMTTRKTTKLVREGKYAAEVPVELIEDETGWSPYLSPEDARKLDACRLALRAGNVTAAARYGRVFELTPLSA